MTCSCETERRRVVGLSKRLRAAHGNDRVSDAEYFRLSDRLQDARADLRDCEADCRRRSRRRGKR